MARAYTGSVKSGIVSSSDEIHEETTRRGFLKACGTAVIAFIAGAACDRPGKAHATAPVWKRIPDQVWAISVPVYLDLASYCTDADGDPLTFDLDQALPPGLALNGSVISGTPSALFSATPFIATADDRG